MTAQGDDINAATEKRTESGRSRGSSVTFAACFCVFLRECRMAISDIPWFLFRSGTARLSSAEDRRERAVGLDARDMVDSDTVVHREGAADVEVSRAVQQRDDG